MTVSVTDTSALIDDLSEAGIMERLSPEQQAAGLDGEDVITGLIMYKRSEDGFVGHLSLSNALGAVYPLLERKQRDRIVHAHLTQFQIVDPEVVRSKHMPLIR